MIEGYSHPQASILVSTDLDGTLLDHFTYSWHAAQPALQLLRERGIPMVMNTSKTLPEAEALRTQLENDDPFIVENGSAVFLPKKKYANTGEQFDEHGNYWLKKFGEDRESILATLQQMRDDDGYKFSGYADWSIDDVILHTGLSAKAAQASQARLFSEPIHWEDSAKKFAAFSEQVQAKDLKIVRGGRFLHILGQCDKGQAISWLKNYFDNAALIALGDSQNDVDMLNVADTAVLVRSPVHDFPELSTGAKIIHTKEYGPIGWNAAIHDLIR